MECLLCGNEILNKNKNKIFCKQCRKEFPTDYLTVFKNIRRDNLYSIEDAKNIKEEIDKGKSKQEIENKLNIPKKKLKWIVKYFYPQSEINFKFGRKSDIEIHNVVRVTKDDIKDEIIKLNNYGICGTDIAIITRVSYNRLQQKGLKMNGVNKDLYPFVYQNIYDEWFYFNYDGNRKVFLISSNEEDLKNKIKEKGYEMGRSLE